MAHITYGTVTKPNDYIPISLAECKTWLLIASTITNDDAFVELIRKGVVGFVENNYDNYLVERKITLEKHDIEDTTTDQITLKYFPLHTVEVLYDDVNTVVDTDDYFVYAQNGIIKLDDEFFTEGRCSVQCSYYTGYRESEFPDHLKMGLLELVKIVYDEFVTTKETFTEQIGRYLLTKKALSSALPPHIENLFQTSFGDKGI